MEKMKNSIRQNDETSESNNQKKACCNQDDPAEICCKENERNVDGDKSVNASGCCTPNEKGKVGCC